MMHEDGIEIDESILRSGSGAYGGGEGVEVGRDGVECSNGGGWDLRSIWRGSPPEPYVVEHVGEVDAAGRSGPIAVPLPSDDEMSADEAGGHFACSVPKKKSLVLLAVAGALVVLAVGVGAGVGAQPRSTVTSAAVSLDYCMKQHPEWMDDDDEAEETFMKREVVTDEPTAVPTLEPTLMPTTDEPAVDLDDWFPITDDGEEVRARALVEEEEEKPARRKLVRRELRGGEAAAQGPKKAVRGLAHKRAAQRLGGEPESGGRNLEQYATCDELLAHWWGKAGKGAKGSKSSCVTSKSSKATSTKSGKSWNSNDYVPTGSPTEEASMSYWGKSGKSGSKGGKSSKSSKSDGCETLSPTSSPTGTPTAGPSAGPTASPTKRPTDSPTESPTKMPTGKPTDNPTQSPTKRPTENPTANPTESPTKKPTENPTANPTESPTMRPTGDPTDNPTQSPTKRPTENPTANPTKSPTKKPTESPTSNPTESPTKKPTESPTANPTESPTKKPTESPTANPTESPTKKPTESPTANPTKAPTVEPTSLPNTCAIVNEPPFSEPIDNNDACKATQACCVSGTGGPNNSYQVTCKGFAACQIGPSSEDGCAQDSVCAAGGPFEDSQGNTIPGAKQCTGPNGSCAAGHVCCKYKDGPAEGTFACFAEDTSGSDIYGNCPMQ